jgi:hypothetical protein
MSCFCEVDTPAEYGPTGLTVRRTKLGATMLSAQISRHLSAPQMAAGDNLGRSDNAALSFDKN